MKRILLILVFFFSVIQNGNASHMAGGHFDYEYIEPDTYLITFSFFRDCEGATVSPPNLARFSNACTDPCVNLGPMTQISVSTADYGCGGNCDDFGDAPKVYELYVFQQTVVLPYECSDWTFAVNIDFRNDVDYVLNGGNYYNYIMINNEGGIINDSPKYNDISVTLSCLNFYTTFSNEHTDAEGTS